MASKLDKMMAQQKNMPSTEESILKSQSALGLTSQSIKRETLDVELDAIIFNPNNDYANEDTEEDIRRFKEDIKRTGLLHNIVVSYRPNGEKVLLSGERRLRAFRMLREEDPTNEEWQTMPTLVMKGLDELEEMIMLDAANLMARGSSVGSEKQFRKATARFVENLKKKNKISDAEAIALSQNFIAASERTIQRNLNIERNLDETLKEYVDKNIIKKDDAATISSRNKQEQAVVRENMQSLIDAGDVETASAYSEEVAKAVKGLKPVKTVSVSKRVVAADAATASVSNKRLEYFKNCERIDKLITKMLSRSGQIVFMDRTEKGAEKISTRLRELHVKLGELIDAVDK